MKKILLLTLVFTVALGMAHAGNMDKAVGDGTNLILDVVRQVLDVVVDFIGDVLDEFVRAFKELFNSSGGQK